MRAKLTCLVPCKNEAANIEACIESFREIADEVLIADSGSTDETKEIVRALLERRRHVTYAEFDSPFGHDSFLIEIDSLEKMVKPFLARALDARRSARQTA